MKLLFLGRRRGKTTKVVRWVKVGFRNSHFSFSRVMLVMNPAERVRIIAEYELDEHQVFTWEDWQRRVHGMPKETEVAFDNAEFILSNIAGGRRIAMVTISKMPGDEVEFTTS